MSFCQTDRLLPPVTLFCAVYIFLHLFCPKDHWSIDVILVPYLSHLHIIVSIFTEHFSQPKLPDGIWNLILGIFSLRILVYHKISTSSVLVIRCRNLMIPKIRCFFNVNAQFITAILIDNSGIWYSYLAGKVELINGKIDKKKYSDHLPLKFEIMGE